jgi:hypothetical protein
MQEFPSFKKIIFIAVLLICFFILYNLIQQRNLLLDQNSDTTKEGFSSETNTMATIRNTSMSNTLPLKQYVIMSSWNSCVESTYKVSLKQLTHVLENGCRFLDFEVYNVDDKPVIGYSSSGYIATQPNQEIDSNTLKFRDVCNLVASTSNAPNKNDPLFLHFRVKTNNMSILEKMAIDIMGSGLKDKGLGDESLSGDMLLSELQNKVIILIDKTYVPNIDRDVCRVGCEMDIRDMIDYSGVSSFSSMKLSQQLEQNVRPLQKETDDVSNAKKWKMVTHDFGTHYIDHNASYMDFKKMVLEHRAQIIPFKFQYSDEALTEYKNFFSDNGHRAFVPLAVAHDALLFSSSN